jgi:hypothetical protein
MLGGYEHDLPGSGYGPVEGLCQNVNKFRNFYFWVLHSVACIIKDIRSDGFIIILNLGIC